MPAHPFRQRITSLVLAWFVAYLTVAGVAPWLHGPDADEICAPVASALSQPGDPSLPAKAHTLDCPQCIGIAGPPAVFTLVLPSPAPLGHVLLSQVAAHLASLTGAPLPARGPPSFS